MKDPAFFRHVLRLSIPLILQQLLRISVDTVNSILLGRIDQIQMSAVAQANQVFFVFFTVLTGLSVGTSVLVSQYWGKKDRDSISVIVAHALRIAFALGLTVSVCIIAFPRAFMRIYASDPMILSIGSGYLRLTAFMYAVCGVSVTLFGASRGVEQVRLIVITNLISYSVNILLDWILIYGLFGLPRLGVTGIAIGTIVARYVEFFAAAFLFLRKKEIPFSAEDLRRSDPELRTSLIKVSLPIVAHEMVWSLGTSSGAMITGQLGASAVAGYNVTSVLYDICASFGNGFSGACSVVLGMTLGTGNREKAKQEASTIILMGLGMGIVLGIFTFAVKDLFLGLYSLDADAVMYARQFMNIIAAVWPFSLLEMVGMIAILRAGGDGKTGFYADIVIMWMICIPLAWTAAFRLGAEPWVVVAIIKSIIVLEAIVGIIRVYQYRWLRNLTRG